jgi:EmrB/QacA subfamily drug resistance transporter
MQPIQNNENKINKTILLIVTMTSNFFNPLMGSAVNVALPKIGTEFSMSAVGLSWVSMSYLLASAMFLVPFGKIGDMFGRKKIFLYGNIIFTVSTLICGFAISDTMLISTRFIQGIASAMIFSTSMAIVISAFPPQERGKVIGFNVTSVYFGLSAAPMIGGLFTDTIGWRSLFYVNAAACTIISILILLKVKQDWAEEEKEKFDFFGSVVYMISISMLMYGFSKLPKIHAIILAILGITGLIFFVIIEKRTKSPVLNMKLFAENKVFAFSNLSALINYAATFAISFILSLYLQYVKGLSAKEAGIILIAQPIMMAIVASFAGKLSDKKDPRVLASIGMAISVVGLFILSFILKDTPYWFFIIGLLILGVGFGLFSSPNTNSVMSSVERRFYGVASATLGTMRTIGMMFSMAIASLSIHIFIGDAKIGAENLPQFITSSRIVFIIFTVLCFGGIFSSMVGIRKKNLEHP